MYASTAVIAYMIGFDNNLISTASFVDWSKIGLGRKGCLKKMLKKC
jgi:hypothetical protein